MRNIVDPVLEKLISKMASNYRIEIGEETVEMLQDLARQFTSDAVWSVGGQIMDEERYFPPRSEWLIRLNTLLATSKNLAPPELPPYADPETHRRMRFEEISQICNSIMKGKGVAGYQPTVLCQYCQDSGLLMVWRQIDYDRCVMGDDGRLLKTAESILAVRHQPYSQPAERPPGDGWEGCVHRCDCEAAKRRSSGIPVYHPQKPSGPQQQDLLPKKPAISLVQKKGSKNSA
jgi:hypothetical protein